MDHLLENISIVGTAHHENEIMDVCALVTSDYVATKKALKVYLDSFLRHTDAARVKERVRVSWLPEPQLVHESVPEEQAGDMSRNMARSWRKKVVESIPGRKF